MWNNVDLLNRITYSLLILAGIGLVVIVSIKITRLDVFSIKEILITGEIHLDTKKQLESVIRERVRGGFFTIDLDDTKSTFEMLARVRMAHIRRKWPATLQVEIVEYKPLALWNETGFVSRQGNVVMAKVEGRLAKNLPIFKGPDQTSQDILFFYVNTKKILQQVGQEVVQINVDSRYTWEVILNNGIALRLGKDRQMKRLARFVNFSRYAMGDIPEKIDYLDMRYEDGFAVGVKG